MARVAARYEKLNDFQARITIVTMSAYLGETSESSGVLYARAPDLVRVELAAPAAQTVVYDGRHTCVYVEGGDQAFRYPGSGVAYLVDLPGALERLSADYDVALVSETAARTFELHLTARTNAAAFAKIHLWIDGPTLLARRTDFYDAAGNNTSYRLSDYRLNLGLAPDLFTLDLPPGVEVVDVSGPGGP